LYNNATVSWSSNYNGHVILEYSADNFNWNLIDETQRVASLTPGKKYFVRGKMACANIASDYIYASFTTPCPKVSMLNVDAVTPFSGVVTWVDESNTNAYTVMIATTAGSEVTTRQTNSNSFSINGLSPGTQYKISVAPQCIIAQDFTSTTFSTICYSPFNLKVDSIKRTTAQLFWDTDFTNTPYIVEYTIAGNNKWMSIDASSNAIQLTNLQPGTEYEARVHITCLSVTEPYVSLHFTTGVYDATMFAPNPTDNTITIYPSRNLIGNHFSIYDNMGKEAGNGVLTNYTINFSDYAAGLYTLRIDGEKPMKIVKR
jgi:hypothetical protein